MGGIPKKKTTACGGSIFDEEAASPPEVVWTAIDNPSIRYNLPSVQRIKGRVSVWESDQSEWASPTRDPRPVRESGR